MRAIRCPSVRANVVNQGDKALASKQCRVSHYVHPSGTFPIFWAGCLPSVDMTLHSLRHSRRNTNRRLTLGAAWVVRILRSECQSVGEWRGWSKHRESKASWGGSDKTAAMSLGQLTRIGC